jgi:hypothetical protein
MPSQYLGHHTKIGGGLEFAEQRWKTKGRHLGFAVGSTDMAARQTRFGMAVEEGNHSSQRARIRECIRVEDVEVGRRTFQREGATHGLVDPIAKAAVARRLNKHNFVPPVIPACGFLEERNGIVPRCVVNQVDAERCDRLHFPA